MTDADVRLTVQATYDLAGDLVRELGPIHSDPVAIDALCRRWLSVLGARRYGLVCAAAMRTVFADCLTSVPVMPPGATAFTQPEETP